MIENTVILCCMVGFIAFYYFNKFNQIERTYYILHRQFLESCKENKKMKVKIADLQLYKDDVSKTFKILDNELLMINDHIKKQTTIPSTENEDESNRISILSPQVLNSLFESMNQESTFSIDETGNETGNENNINMGFENSSGDYDRFLIN